MSNWPTKKLGEVCDFIFGYSFRADNFNTAGKGLPVIRIGDIDKGITEKFYDKEYNNRYLVEKGDILIGLSGTIKVNKWRGKKALLNQRIVKICDFNSEVLEDFVFYQLPQILKRLEIQISQGTVKNVLLPHLSNLKILVPPLPIQQKIVERLDAIRKAQELNDKQIELAEELFQSLLHRELDPKGKNWETKQLGEVIETIESGSRPRGGAVSAGVPSLGVEHINEDGSFNIGELKYIPEDFFDNLKRGRIKKLDILIAKDGATTGKTVIVGTDFPFDKVAVNEHLFIIRGNPNVISQKFLFYTLSGSDGKKQILKTKHGAAQGGIDQSFVNFVQIPLPPIETQRKIVEKLSAVEEYKKKLIEQKENLQELFDSVLNKSFKGEF